MNNDYVKRNLMKREEFYKFGEYAPFLKESFLDLYSLITTKTKRIVLLGDAGYGKSTELKIVTCRFIEEESQDFTPILIELNTYVDEEMIDYVKNKIGEESKSLLDYEKSKLIFLFDEFDQVINKEIAVRRIKNFIEKYNESTFIIACRTNFYSGQFEDFNVVVLLRFNSNDIKHHSRRLLNNESKTFLNQLESYSYFDLAKNPFFLNHLIEIFKIDKNIPATPTKIFSRIVSLVLENDAKRLTSKYDLKQSYPTTEIEKDLIYVSLIMETLQRNFITIDEFNKIISDKNKRSVIPELSLIRKSFFKEGDVYQFQHNNFQEYLAAKVLSSQNLNTILEFISFRSTIKRGLTWIEKLVVTLEYVDFKPFGIKVDRLVSTLLKLIRYRRIDKINPSWVNTVAFICQLREKNDLLKYLMKNEPELALKFEISRIDEVKRKELFKTIFEKYTRKRIWIDRSIDYEEMANFGKTQEIYNYLIKYALSKEHFTHRYNAIQMLGRMKGLEDETLRNLLIQYAKDENENQNVRHISFYALSWLGMASSDTIDALKQLKESKDDWILSGLYYLIKESTYSDKYVDILLAGISKTRSKIHSSKSRLADESWNLTRGLEKVQSVEGVRKIIRYFIDHPGDLTEFYMEKSMEKIVNNMIKAYEHDNSIYDDVKELAKNVNKRYFDKAVSKIVQFFKSTKTNYEYFREIIQGGIENNYDLLAAIADEQCIDFLIDQYLESKITENNIWVLIYSLSSKNKDNFDNLLKIINQKTDNKFVPQQTRDYKKEQKEKMKREIEIIFDKNEYLKEAENIYNGENKDMFNYEDINDLLYKRDNGNKYNELVMREISSYFEKNKDKTLEFNDLKNKIMQCDFEWFTISHIFDLLYHGRELSLSEEQKSLIKEYCLENINKVNFREALKPKDKGATTSQLPIILWYFMRSFNFEYPEDVLLDMLSFDWIEGLEFVGIDYLENKLSLQTVRSRIVENLNRGIEVDQVLKNHIVYCKKYKILEARGQLYIIIENPKIDIENRLLALETVAYFPDSTSFLEKILDTNELKLFNKVAEILLSHNNKECEKKLVLNLTSQGKDIALESAKLLIEKQNLKAIKFYANQVKRTKIFEVDIHDRNPLQKIKTIRALPILFDLLKFSYEFKSEIKQEEFHRLDSAIIDVLKNISTQNFSYFNKVTRGIQKFIKKYHFRFKDINFLNIASDNIEKSFFISYTSQIPVDAAIKKVQKLNGNGDGSNFFIFYRSGKSKRI